MKIPEKFKDKKFRSTCLDIAIIVLAVAFAITVYIVVTDMIQFNRALRQMEQSRGIVENTLYQLPNVPQYDPNAPKVAMLTPNFDVRGLA